MENLYDVLIIGGGPAGLTAALYLARARYRVLVLEKEKFGGQITITSEIVNYPGVESASGKELTETMRIQAQNFGAEFALAEVTEMQLEGDTKVLKTADGREFKALGVVLSPGASPRKIGFTGEKEFQGRGVAYCATCDGEFFTGREVLVIGGGFAAVEESMFLTKYASKVTILVRGGEFSCAAGTVEQLADYPSIEVRYHTEVQEVGGDGILTWAKCKNNQTGEEFTYRSADGGPLGVFVFAGYEPATKWMGGAVKLTEQGYIVTDRSQKTSVDGVYAAGDVCVKNLRQVVTAVGDGAVAATSLEKHVSEVRKKLGLPKAEGGIRTGERNTKALHAGAGKQNAGRAGNTSAAKTADSKSSAASGADSGAFISAAMKEQLAGVFSRFERTVQAVAVTNGQGASAELEGFVGELKGISEKVQTGTEKANVELAYIDIRVNGQPAGIRYFSIPGGHEFNSFVIALYNAAGPGQAADAEVLKTIENIRKKHILQVMTTLSCTNCPDVVMGTQKMAAVSSNIEAEMYDVAKFPELKEKYKIMAVPCMVLDGEKTYFGKRSLKEIAEIVKADGE